jgi:hypothetical protein
MLPARNPPPPPVPVTLAKLLLVEGDTPMHFFEALLRRLGLQDNIEIRNFRGIGDFKNYVINLADTDEFKRLVTSVGVVRDAEGDAVAARKTVTASLIDAGLTQARNPPIQTKIFILPDNTNSGMIETLCMEAVQNEPALAGVCGCVEDFFACLARNNVSMPGSPYLAKHRAQAFLATRSEVQLFPGLAAYRGYWPWDNLVFDPLKRFLQAL